MFIHGFPFDGSMWDAQLDAMPDGWRGLAPDLRGFGQSPLDAAPGEVASGRRIGGRIARDSEPVLTMARLADDVASLIAAETDGSAVVCGLSMGGYVAFELWRRHPGSVRALVLADTRAAADDDEGRENRMRTAHTARESGPRPIATAMIPALLAAENRQDGAPLVDRVREMILATPPTTLIAALAGMATRHDATRELSAIRVPTLVIAGELDTITPPDDARALAAALPQVRLDLIPGAGHLSPLEEPAAFNGALARFLTTL